METKHEASMARTLRAEQHKNTEAHYQDGRRSLKTKMFFIAFCFLLIGDLCGGAWVYYHGPKVGGWDSFGSKSYAELIEEHERDVAIHDEDVRLHVIDVRLHGEGVLKHSFNVKNQRELADRLAVLNSQNKWLWRKRRPAMLAANDAFANELARVGLSDLPPGWVSEYRQLSVRLKQINATNVLEHLNSKRIGVEAAAVGDHPLGGGR